MKYTLTILAIMLNAAAAEPSNVNLLPSAWNMAYGKSPAKKVHLYKNDDNKYIQEFNINFRGQYQVAGIHSNQGNYDGSHNWTSEWRRFRLGWNAKVLQNFKLTNIWNMGGLDTAGYVQNGVWHDHGQTKGSLYEASVQYIYKNNNFFVGKTLPATFLENRYSSANYDVPELSVAENTVVYDSSWGICASTNDLEKSKFGYYAGLWSATNTEDKGLWGTWESAYSTLGVSYRADKAILKEGRVYLDWVHNFDEGSVRSWDDIYCGTYAQDTTALYYIGKQDKFGLSAQVLWGKNPNDHQRKDGSTARPSDIVAYTVMPSYFLTDHVKLVARFHYAHGDDAVKLNKRYETTLSRTSGENGNYVDTYYSAGLGATFYVYKDEPTRLKIMSMVEYGNSGRSAGSTKGGFTGWQFISGVYTNF